MTHSLEEIGEEIVRQFVEMNEKLQDVLSVLETISVSIGDTESMVEDISQDTYGLSECAKKLLRNKDISDE